MKGIDPMPSVARLAVSNTDSAVALRGAQYPAQNPSVVLETEISALCQISAEFYQQREDERRLSIALERAAPLLGNYAGELRREIEAALVPATSTEIQKHIVLLLDSNPRAQRLTASFGELVESDVGALQPSCGAIESACRYLRITPRPEFKPVPDIPEILETVRAKQGLLEAALKVLEVMPNRIAAARTQLDALTDQRLNGVERQKATIRKFLTAEGADATGKEALGDWRRPVPSCLSVFDKALVEQVRAEIAAERDRLRLSGAS
jgi:hypothetical protein